MDAPSTFEPQAVLGRRRVAWNRIGIVLPVLALILAVLGGVSGPRPGDLPNGSRTDAASPDTGTAQGADAPSPATPDSLAQVVPATVLGLQVRTLQDLYSGLVDEDAPLAIAGWYRARPAAPCPRSTGVEQPDLAAELGVVADARTFCERAGVLRSYLPDAESPERPGAVLRHELSVTLTPGVAAPPELAGTARDARFVVFVGRLADPQYTCRLSPACPGALVVDRVVWVSGMGQAQTTSILPRLLDPGPRLAWRPRDRLAEATVGPSGAVLMETLIDLPMLATIDPAAAAIVSTAAGPGERIWYRRALALDPASAAPTWVAIDDASGAVLGSGSVGA